MALRWSENSTPWSLAAAISRSRKAHSAARLITVASRISPAWRPTEGREDGHGAVGGDQLDLHLGGGVDGDGPLVGAEVAAVHGGHVGLRIRRPRPHRMRVLAGVALDRGGGPPVGVPFPEDGVDGAARHLLVAALDLPLLRRGRLVGVVGQRVPLGLQLGDGRLELRDGGADVRQLDDVGLGRRRQPAEFGQGVADPLLLGQPLRETGQDPPRQRDVAALDRPRRPRPRRPRRSAGTSRSPAPAPRRCGCR